MYKARIGLLTRTLLSQRQIPQKQVRILQAYSSLRKVRQPGPRSRVLSHVEPLRKTRTPVAPQAASAVEGGLEHNDDTVDNTTSPISDTLVQVPTDAEHQVIKPDSAGAALLTQPAIVVGRELEMMNVFLGYEQANKYKIMDANGNHLGYIAEEEGFGKSISRQLLRTHRKMNATILNLEGDVMFKIVRPYSLVNSRIYIYTADDELVGEVQQRWNLVRRKYDLFVGTSQFASIDTPFLGWDFNLTDEHGGALGNVSRNFVGFAREIFTDTGEYVLRMDAVDGNSRGMTLDERAVTLACAISIDFDYFSRHSSHGGGGFLPFPMMMGGGERHEGEVDGGAVTGGAAAGGATGAATGGAVGAAGGDFGGGSYGSGDYGSASTPPPPPPPPAENTNEWGDPWLSDEQAGVSNPDDEGGFFDSLSDFFGDSN
ncbi:Scramblase-domain-containing protein [Mucor mucedo]|uniref:Scramblase-domain-containing protein n=1 Tax=Mucor mucedo TaxID=29922 RepID=UPI00221F5F33|nr:Scramblase-domain-containing protein [Mucor mucedo]KAI7864715.1 Scramblase-domain-containing protein [Mucor mucedo]